MKLKIDVIRGKCNANEEYVALTALEDCNLDKYMVADTSYIEKNRISNRHRHTFWFNSTDIKKGERVMLHTKEGTYSTTHSGGVKWHHFYWCLKTAVWNNEGDAAVLFEINNWFTTTAQ